jgi:hypothetical protein
MTIAEQFVLRAFVLEDQAKELKAKLPPRQKP